MGKKVFRLYNGGNNTITDWQESEGYGTNAINQIQDPDGSTARKEITSIPSPFARVDLVKTAFGVVANSGNIDGNTIFHKMVSDSLDIAQIFFDYERLKTKVKIIVWDKEQSLADLLRQDSTRIVKDTLDIFLEQDAAVYHFDKMQRIYLLQYVGSFQKTTLDVIGATSPATLFFSSANDLNYLSEDIQFGQDKAFDGVYAALHKRDDAFIEYMYAFRKSYPNFPNDFPEVENYLNKVFEELPQTLKTTIGRISVDDINVYPMLKVANNNVDINGILYRGRRPQTINSDFEMKSTISHGARPLALPIVSGSLYEKHRYTQAPWGRINKAPAYDSQPIEQRALPADGSKYPYLTISDFLESTLVRVESTESTDKDFFDGNISNSSNTHSKYKYLLPLTTCFFDYFTVEDLVNPKGRPMIEIRERAADTVVVTLRIPVRQGEIEYERHYTQGQIPDEANNKGGLIDKDFVVGLFSNIKYTNDIEASYRIVLMANFKEAGMYQLECIHNNNQIPLTEVIRNDSEQGNEKCKTYIIEKTNFDYCRIECGNEGRGILIPHFVIQQNGDQYTFAIDLGTTNTHIEYCVNGSNDSHPFTVGTLLSLWGCVTGGYGTRRKNILQYDYLPEQIGGEFVFPIRTVLNEGKSTNWNHAVFPMGQANIPYPYDKYIGPRYDKLLTNLKWSNDKYHIMQIKCYIETLFLSLRNMVLHNGGDLARTKIVWFYPISMIRNRFNSFNDEWNRAYKTYFGSNSKNVIPMTESIAPYEYYLSTDLATNNIATIDIGGGTTDIVIAEGGEIKGITSFRFAANSVFGNATSGSLNHIVSKYKGEISKILNDNSLFELDRILNEHYNSGNSNDTASFLFSLKDNYAINIQDKVDFNKILQRDDNYKIVFLLFYAALIYHVARIMKAKGLSMPRHIGFSGNGSKIIQILSSSEDTLADYTKLIFEKVYGSSYPRDGLNIILSPHPKEITCKGGALKPTMQSYTDMLATKIVFKSSDSDKPFVSTETYKDITDKHIIDCVKEASNFVRTILDMNSDFSYSKNFGVEPKSLKVAEDVCFRDLETYTKKGLEQKRSEVSDDDVVEETMFFYPINGMLNALSKELK